MKVIQTAVNDVVVIEPKVFGDNRGFFSPLFEDRQFKNAGITEDFSRINNSLSATKGTLRGMHYQPPPFQEGKLLRVIKGAIWDVALDLRRDSPTFGKWAAATLTAENRTLFYVPPGCAHGFQTLEDDTEVIYLCSNYYNPSIERGVRWNDPRFQIEWPLPPTIISDKDQQHPLFSADVHLW